jgi:hypothetical protein
MGISDSLALITTGQNIITKNVIENNNIGIKFWLSDEQVFCNKICNNVIYDFYYDVQFGSNISVPNNYWCATDSIIITSKILDGYDNISLGLVTFMPIDTIGCYLISGISNGEIENSSLQIFPNPANDNLTVRLFNDKPAGEIRIYNLLGQQYRALTISGDHTTIDVSDLSKGIYIMYLATDKNIYRQKFIKE